MANFNIMTQNFPLITALTLSLFLGLASSYIIHKIFKKYYHPATITPFSVINAAFQRAFYLLLPLLYFSIFSAIFDLPKTSYFMEILVKILITIALSMAAAKCLDYIDIWLLRKKISLKNPADIGPFITRAYLLKKILKIVIVFLALAFILLNFPAVKKLGEGILISAGFIGGILIFAAQKIFSNVFSGMDFILNKPIKVGDSIRISSELGTIEKITLNQIHFRAWDLRLIVYPLSYFNENPFENLSHVENGLRGVIFFYADYKVEVEKIRAALTHILQASPLWDKKSNTLQMTEVNEHSIQLRAVVSAKNADDLWALRCHVREKIIQFIQQDCPEIFPKERIHFDNLSLTKETNQADAPLLT